MDDVDDGVLDMATPEGSVQPAGSVVLDDPQPRPCPCDPRARRVGPRGSVPVRAWAALLLATVLAGCGSTSTGAGVSTSATAAAPGTPATSAQAVDRLPSPSPAPASGAPALARHAAVVGRLPGEPDPTLTPGAFKPAVTQATIGSTICVSGWTATVRPPVSYTNALKRTQIARYGYADTRTADYEEDHLVPLELGGAPSDPRNLWPEPYSDSLSDGRPTGARVKDGFETTLKRAVCVGTITLARARAEIGDHWVHAFYGIPLATGTTTAPAGATPTPRPTPTPGATGSGTLSVRFVALPDPAIAGSPAEMTARTSPGAVCSARVTWPSGTVSTAQGLRPTPTAGADGLVAWTWNVAANTRPGTATASVTCRLGTSASVTAHFPVQ